MKKVISILLIICTLTCCLISCGHETSFSGKWVSKDDLGEPVYLFLDFSGQNVLFGSNLYGNVTTATWNCTYKVDGTTLTLTTEEGTDFVFDIQYEGSTPKFIFKKTGVEFIYVE